MIKTSCLSAHKRETREKEVAAKKEGRGEEGGFFLTFAAFFMELLLSLTAILITTAILILCSCNSRRNRGNSHETVISQDGEVVGVNSAPRSPSTSTMRGDGFEYDVFLSFRGEDTRKGFTGHLYQALKVRGVKTFKDDKKLEKGKRVEELFGYIQRSKIFVTVFSKGYADSEWCLKELARMVECGRLILPVFYDVKPRDVRHQTGPFTAAFKRYRKKGKMDIEEVSKWADALRQVGEISGYNLADTEGDEANLIRLIVKRILTEVNKAEVNKASLFVTKHGVGLDSRIADVMEVLELEPHDDVRMVGIYAMGGMGKTTLAKAVYNQISFHFGACCFIANVREAAGQLSGLVSLQKQLLRSVCKGETLDVTSIDEGIGLIKERIQRKMILLILDDVDHESQLDALAGGLDWFGSGSRIIVTTRDKGVLRAPRVNPKGIYELKELDAAESLQLFSWHAFGGGQPVDDFAELAKEVAGTAGGLPLALTIFGSLFFDLKTVKEWCNMLERLKEDQDKDIHERLKTSFDALDVKEKKIFLDIACFFIEQKREPATLMWEDCRFFPEITLKVLMHKSLININDDTCEFGMHDHIRDMGRKIVQDESLHNPEMCSSRLWKVGEIIDALQNSKGTKDIEAIKLSRGPYADPMAVEAKSIAAMPQLRMLLLGANVRLDGEYELFPKTLKWLQWCIPENLESLPACVVHLENIVILDLSGSFSITQVWNPRTAARIKVYEKLKVLKLSGCYNLMICPDFTSMPHLEKLRFDGCGKLIRLHPSIGHLKCLAHLSLKGCVSLKELPEDVGHDLISLEILDFSWCTQLTALPPYFMSTPRFKILPQTVGQLASLQVYEKLKVLNLSYCDNLMICPDFTSMPHLEKLDFCGCKKLRRLHPSIGILKCLTHLSLMGCESLEELPLDIWHDLISLEVLDLSRCIQLTALPPYFMSMPRLRILNLRGCSKITELHPSIGHLESLVTLELSLCCSLRELPQEVGHLASLQELRLYFCESISTLPFELGDLKSLRELNLSHTNITTLPESICSLPNLEELDVADCRFLASLPHSLGNLRNLRELNFSGTSITTLSESICSLPNLEVLNVAYCLSLASLPHSLVNLRSLRKLDFSHTAIEELPDSMLLLENLEVLRFRYCERLKVSQASVLIRLMVLKNRSGVSSATTGRRGQLSFDEPSERQDHSQSQILRLRPSLVTELSDPDDPKLDSIAKQLEALNLEDTLWLMDALVIDQSELLEAQRLGISLHGLLRKRFQEAKFQHLLNWLVPRSLGESLYAPSLYLVLPEGFARGTLFLILAEWSQLDSVVVHMDITRACDGRLLFQTSAQAGVWRFDHDDNDDACVDWNEVPQLKLEWHGDGCLPRLVMMHVSISGRLLIDGYLCSDNFYGQFLQHCGQLVVLGISSEVQHAAWNT